MRALPDSKVEGLLEQGIVRQCAPVLMGVKPAGMFNIMQFHQVGRTACGKPLMAQASREQIERACMQADESLREADVHVRALAHRHGSTMLFVWRPTLMEAFIGRDPQATMLEIEGYEVGDAESCVNRFQKRVLSFDRCPRNPNGTDRFPHEVGFLLGYPLEDVMGFVRMREAALARSWWNVYSDEARARRAFRILDSCTRIADQRMCEGDTLAGLAASANLPAHKALALYE